MTEDRFARNGSPLGGRPVPRDWHRCDVGGKIRLLVAADLASDFREAAKLLGQHSAAARRARAAKEAEKKRRAAKAWWLRDDR